MPARLVPTPYGLFGSDSYYADIFGNDGLTEMAIGRIPARTPDEMDAYIDKIAASESNAAGGGWSPTRPM